MHVIKWIVKPRPKQWRSIPGYPAYAVSDVGHIKRVLPAPGGKNTCAGKVLKPRFDGDGYLRYDLYRDGESQSVDEHFAVCLAWHGPKPSPEHEVAHWDGNKRNNDYRNLRWATRAENYADAVRHGRARWHSPLHRHRPRGVHGRYVPGRYGD